MKVLNYKKPEFWGILASTVFFLFIALCLLTNSKPEVAPENVTTENQGNNTSLTHPEEFNGFRASTFDNGDGRLSYIYRYHGIEAEDFSICMDEDGLNSTIYYNGKILDINTYGLFYDGGDKGHALPYLADVTGDGQEELILEYASPDPQGSPYLIHKCYVYRLDTMEQLTFNTDTTKLSKLMIFTPKDFNSKTNKLTLQIEFDEIIHSNLIETDRIPWKITITISPEQADYWTEIRYAYIPNAYDSLYFDTNRQCFVSEFPLYLDSTQTFNIFYPFYVGYIWDEASNSFIMDLSTARIPAAG